MRIALVMVISLAVTACGQTGSLYLPDDAVETPVEIRAPATSAPTPTPVPEPEPTAPADEDEEKKYTQLPGG